MCGAHSVTPIKTSSMRRMSEKSALTFVKSNIRRRHDGPVFVQVGRSDVCLATSVFALCFVNTEESALSLVLKHCFRCGSMDTFTVGWRAFMSYPHFFSSYNHTVALSMRFTTLELAHHFYLLSVILLRLFPRSSRHAFLPFGFILPSLPGDDRDCAGETLFVAK